MAVWGFRFWFNKVKCVTNKKDYETAKDDNLTYNGLLSGRLITQDALINIFRG